jgi:hypothetical protein
MKKKSTISYMQIKPNRAQSSQSQWTIVWFNSLQNEWTLVRDETVQCPLHSHSIAKNNCSGILSKKSDQIVWIRTLLARDESLLGTEGLSTYLAKLTLTRMCTKVKWQWLSCRITSFLRIILPSSFMVRQLWTRWSLVEMDHFFVVQATMNLFEFITWSLGRMLILLHLVLIS